MVLGPVVGGFVVAQFGRRLFCIRRAFFCRVVLVKARCSSVIGGVNDKEDKQNEKNRISI